LFIKYIDNIDKSKSTFDDCSGGFSAAESSRCSRHGPGAEELDLDLRPLRAAGRVVPGLLGAAALPGLMGAAVRARNRRRDGCTEAKAALADIRGFVEWAAGATNALDCLDGRIFATQAHGSHCHRRRRCAPRVLGARTPAFAQGVGEARSHGSM
jgi:hypothetical protein